MSDEDDESDDEREDERTSLECPYCGSGDRCEHLLLALDRTFRTANGGPLRDAFANRWSTVRDDEDPDFDDGAAFAEEVEAVHALSDAYNEFEFEGGPGMSSTYQGFYCSSKKRVEKAVRTFEADNEESEDSEGDHCPFCKKLNSPAADETCRHQVGWKWDGGFDLHGAADKLHQTWQDAAALIDENSGDPTFDRVVAAAVGSDAQRKKLARLASSEADFLDLLEVVGVSTGEGWVTDGMLGGSGFNLYTKNRRPLNEAAAFFKRICQQAAR